MKFKNESNESIIIMIEPRAELFIIKPGMIVNLVNGNGGEHLDCPIYYSKRSIEFWETDDCDIEVLLDGKPMEDSWEEYNSTKQSE